MENVNSLLGKADDLKREAFKLAYDEVERLAIKALKGINTSLVFAWLWGEGVLNVNARRDLTGPVIAGC